MRFEYVLLSILGGFFLAVIGAFWLVLKFQ